MSTLEGKGQCDLLTFYQYKALLHSKGHLKCRIISDSMFPLIKRNETVVIEKIDDHRTIKTFDILVFLNHHELFCHFVWHTGGHENRILSTRSLSDYFHNDLPLDYDKLLGRVTNKQLSRLTKAKIILWNILRRSA